MQRRVESGAVTDAAPEITSDELRQARCVPATSPLRTPHHPAAYPPSPPDERYQARILFGEMDRDRNGVLDEAEFAAMMRSLSRGGRRDSWSKMPPALCDDRAPSLRLGDPRA